MSALISESNGSGLAQISVPCLSMVAWISFLRDSPGIWILLYLQQAKLRGTKLEIPPHPAGCGQEIIQDESLLTAGRSPAFGLTMLPIVGWHGRLARTRMNLLASLHLPRGTEDNRLSWRIGGPLGSISVSALSLGPLVVVSDSKGERLFCFLRLLI